MKAMSKLMCCAVLMAGSAGIALADDAPPDPAAYKQKMHDCVTQMKSDHPDMNYKARRKACHKQLGPMPKASSTQQPAMPPAPAPMAPPPANP